MTYSFCFSIPYGAIVAVGGMIGFMKAGSKMSLMMGVLFGGIQMALGYSAYLKYYARTPDQPEIIGGLFFALCLGMVMGQRALKSGKFMPAGLVASLSIAISLFYLYRLKFPLPLKAS